MASIKNLSIKWRITGIIMVMFVAIVAVAFIGLNLAQSANQGGRDTYELSMKPTQNLAEISHLMSENRSQIMLALQHDPTSAGAKLHDHPITMHTDAIIKNRDEVAVLWDGYIKMIDDPEEKKLADEFAEKRSLYVKEGLMTAHELLLAGNYMEAQLTLLKKVNPLYAQATAAGAKVEEFLEGEVKGRLEKSENDFNNSRNTIVIGVGVLLVLIVLASLWIIRSITGPLSRAVDAATRLSEGDLTVKIAVDSKDEMGQLLLAMQTMVEKLTSIISEVNVASDALNNAAGQVSATAQSLSQSSSEQAASVEETT
ncbi:MAG: methyl-accepting chemotaxis protein, partial [Pseudomonadota bacterium]